MTNASPFPDLSTAVLPFGVSLRPLQEHSDGPVRTTQIFARAWPLEVVPVQWNLVNSAANTLRGVHVHLTHWDYLFVVSGEMLLGLHDMRPDSPTRRTSAQRRLTGESPCGIAIPPGVAHGFCFASKATYFYAVSHYWNPSDELGCRWNDPELGLSWPVSGPLLSPRDAAASDYGALERAVAAGLDRTPVRS
jgi:dTDP-4-dehydrorhamnose 3,5-epimerase